MLEAFCIILMSNIYLKIFFSTISLLKLKMFQVMKFV